MKRVNSLKQILNRGETAIGTTVLSCSAAIVEVAGYSGLDYVRLEGEHAWRRDESMEHMIRAAFVTGITTIVRLEKNDPNLIRKALEIGAGGVVITNIVSREEAEKAISAAKFPPKGVRGYTSVCFSGQWGAATGEDIVNWGDNETLVGIMVENEEVVSHLNEILPLDGLDFAIFGPADYSMSIGLEKPQKEHPKVQAAIKKTIDVANKHNKPVGIGVGQPWEEETKKYFDLGFRMLEIGIDLTNLRSIWKPVAMNIRHFKRP